MIFLDLKSKNNELSTLQKLKSYVYLIVQKGKKSHSDRVQNQIKWIPDERE